MIFEFNLDKWHVVKRLIVDNINYIGYTPLQSFYEHIFEVLNRNRDLASTQVRERCGVNRGRGFGRFLGKHVKRRQNDYQQEKKYSQTSSH